MKLHTLKIIVCFLAFGNSVCAQVSNYVFTQANGVFAPLPAGGPILGTINNDDELFVVNTIGSPSNQTGTGFPIGFTFTYNGAPYTQFGVSANGYIMLGNLPAFTMPINPCNCFGNVPSGTVNIANGIALFGNSNLISALNYDLQGQAGATLKFLTIGATPNRSLVVEWIGYQSYGIGGDNYNFQIQLLETSNIIQFVYGPFAHDGTLEDARVGLYGVSNADFFMRTDPANWLTTTNFLSSSASVAFNGSTLPTNGLTFIYTPPNTLPIDLMNFSALPNGEKVDLKWETASEITNAYFTIEKSENGIDFTKLTDVAAASNSDINKDYEATDDHPFNGTSYYRLKQTDINGNYKYFKSVAVNLNSKVDINTYPNIVSNTNPLNINLSGYKNQEIKVAIKNIEGRDVYSKTYFSDQDKLSFKIDQLNNLPIGLFVVIVTTNDTVYTQKIVKE